MHIHKPRVAVGLVAATMLLAFVFPSGVAQFSRDQFTPDQFSPDQFSPSQSGTSKLPPLQSAETSPLQSDTPDPNKARQQAMLDRSLNDARHKRLQTDTDKLLTLATELKSEVDRSTKNELSVDVVRKAAEIEKLAHDVKERMKS